jgi:AcrR family transcriptional regulator
MTVNGAPGHTRRRTQAERSSATRAALLGAARRLFAEKGFAGTGREEIVEAAGVTRGALYHHFESKEGLFRAVFEALESEIVARVADAALVSPDPMQQLRLGSHAFLDTAMDPAVRRVVLLDGPSVLDVAVRRTISDAYGLGMVREVLRAVMAAGTIERQPLEPLAHILLAALHEAALYVAQADDPMAARAEVAVTVDRLLDGL